MNNLLKGGYIKPLKVIPSYTLIKRGRRSRKIHATPAPFWMIIEDYSDNASSLLELELDFQRWGIHSLFPTTQWYIVKFDHFFCILSLSHSVYTS